MRTTFPYQTDLFARQSTRAPEHAHFNGRSDAFVDNLSLPVDRWYRYSAGFSADWGRRLVRERRPGTKVKGFLTRWSMVGKPE